VTVLRQRRLDALQKLALRLAGESGGGVVADALELTLAASSARAGAAFGTNSSPNPLADRGLGQDPIRSARLEHVMATLARRVFASRRRLFAPDVRNMDRDEPGEFVAGELVASGFKAVLAIPIEHRRRVLGVLVLLFEDGRALDVEAASFVETVAHMLALVLERDRRHEEDQAERDEFAEASRLASLGVLTASVAHELRGPAGALMLQIEEQRRFIEQFELLIGPADNALHAAAAELGELTGDIETAVLRLRATIDQLTTLSRRDSSPENLDLGAVVRDSLSVARGYLERRGISLSEQLEPCFTKGRRDNLAQVVLNLLFNAAEACEGSARRVIGIRTLEEGDQVVLVVDDSGPGVAKNAMRDMFSALYKSKNRHAMGLGLKVSSDVVSAHGGHIEVINRPEGGASFRVVLPKVDIDSGVHPVALPRGVQGRPELVRAPRRVLVVDDDPVFSRAVRRALKPHEVRNASTASEAEIVLLDPEYLPDLVICNVFLPGANGNALHARIAERRPDVARRFVFVSGGLLGKSEADYLKTSGCPTLPKPHDPEMLLEGIEWAGPDSAHPNSVRTLSAPSFPAVCDSTSPPTLRR
jgi:signal transduction histidine kinase/ActR/RegA family two-component response regulator